MSDLFYQKSTPTPSDSYDASAIEVLEGLEPVRRRPGMYIGGTDSRSLHHLVAEILDNAMDEAVAGHADKIELTLHTGNRVTVRDNGRGIPVDPHPKFPGKSALEVILTTLHSGGKFSDKAYETSGGLHGVGMSVVNALSDELNVTITKGGQTYTQTYSRGAPITPLSSTSAKIGGRNAPSGTTITFHPDPLIFGDELQLSARTLYELARSKAYLHRGLTLVWQWDGAESPDGADSAPEEGAGKPVPQHHIFKFNNGLADFIENEVKEVDRLPIPAFSGQVRFGTSTGKVDFACLWLEDADGWLRSYCNTVPTPQGGTHENGFRTALLRAIRHFAELTNQKKASIITIDDVLSHMACMLSVFIPQPQFQGQTKEKLTSPEAAKLVENAMKDICDHFLAAQPDKSQLLLQTLIERAEWREKQKEEKTLNRKSATRKLRLPGKLADCARSTSEGTEVFLVEGDSAGGSAKQARDRETQAVLPLRGKILNVASASADKIRGNQEVQDMILALGCGVGKDCKPENLRYEKIVIMTDADVDGAHISSLLIAFFYTQMRPLIAKGHLYLAQPPLYRLAHGATSVYARDDADKDRLMATTFKGKKVEISRFKGLGEMPARQLKETTMDMKSRTLIRVNLAVAAAIASPLETVQIMDEDNLVDKQGDAFAMTAESFDENGEAIALIAPVSPPPRNEAAELDDLVDRLMGKNAEGRFTFIQENASFVQDIDI